jgi:hypothetical protein
MTEPRTFLFMDTDTLNVFGSFEGSIEELKHQVRMLKDDDRFMVVEFDLEGHVVESDPLEEIGWYDG